jgi:hypothetical protein
VLGNRQSILERNHDVSDAEGGERGRNNVRHRGGPDPVGGRHCLGGPIPQHQRGEYEQGETHYKRALVRAPPCKQRHHRKIIL